MKCKDAASCQYVPALLKLWLVSGNKRMDKLALIYSRYATVVPRNGSDILFHCKWRLHVSHNEEQDMISDDESVTVQQAKLHQFFPLLPEHTYACIHKHIYTSQYHNNTFSTLLPTHFHKIKTPNKTELF